MKKKLLVIVLSLFTLVLTCGTVNGQEETIFVFEDDSNKFISQEGTSPGFEDMLPGETRKVTIVLRNDDQDKMDFFMSAEILDNIAEKGDKNAIYDFTIARDGEVFFTSVIGGRDDTTIGKEYLTADNNIKLATLTKGEESKVTISLTLDGDSTENAYMNQDGQIKLKFSVGTPVENMGEAQTVIQRVVNYVKTGDNAPILILSGLLIVSLGVIIVISKKKKGTR